MYRITLAALWLLAAFALLWALTAPGADASPTPGPKPPGYNCTQTGETYPTYTPCPGDVTGPLRGGGNHRWPDGDDD